MWTHAGEKQVPHEKIEKKEARTIRVILARVAAGRLEQPVNLHGACHRTRCTRHTAACITTRSSRFTGRRSALNWRRTAVHRETCPRCPVRSACMHCAPSATIAIAREVDLELRVSIAGVFIAEGFKFMVTF